jgi:prepilin-type N-terminal cleavage/methylation domain-containing protein
MIKASRQRGFTLVELSLAVVLVSILTLAIMTVSMQIMKIYSKGMTLKTADQASRDISGQLTRDLHSAPVEQINSSQLSRGRLCIGATTYLWNTTTTLNSGSQKITAPSGDVHLMRINDPSQQFCALPLRYDVTAAMQPTELLGKTGSASTGNNLAVYSLNFTQFVKDQPIFAVDYIIGTNNPSVVSGAQCRPPTDSSANFDFCTVSQFHLIIKASVAGGS